MLLFEIRVVAELEGAFDAASAEHADGLLLAGANLARSRQRIVRLAASHRLPTLYPDGQAVREGGLMSYGAHLLELHRRAATYVAKILQGTKPADLPIEQPTTFEFVINLRTACRRSASPSPRTCCSRPPRSFSRGGAISTVQAP